VIFIAAGNSSLIRECNMIDEEKIMGNCDLAGKKILFILPPCNFRDEEYQKPRAIFANAGARVIVASSALAPAEGMFGARVTPDASIKEVKAEDFDAILLVGGVGSNKFWHNATVHNLAREAGRAGKVVSAICLAPVTLANAGLLEGKRATAYPSAESFLKWKGAIYTGNSVEVDGNIVTANGPEAAEEIARAVVRLMYEINFNAR
jgi:protease I